MTRAEEQFEAYWQHGIKTGFDLPESAKASVHQMWLAAWRARGERDREIALHHKHIACVTKAEYECGEDCGKITATAIAQED